MIGCATRHWYYSGAVATSPGRGEDVAGQRIRFAVSGAHVGCRAGSNVDAAAVETTADAPAGARTAGVRSKLVLEPRGLLMAPSPFAGLPRSAPHSRPSAFRIPVLGGMDLHPGNAVVDRYLPPPPPWLHVRIHCAIADGNVYIDGTVTGNYGRPIPGAVIYQGVGDVVTGKVTSSRSGQLHGVEPRSGSQVRLPPGLRRFPMHCVAPNVNVGAPSHVMQGGQGAATVHQDAMGSAYSGHGAI